MCRFIEALGLGLLSGKIFMGLELTVLSYQIQVFPILILLFTFLFYKVLGNKYDEPHEDCSW